MAYLAAASHVVGHDTFRYVRELVDGEAVNKVWEVMAAQLRAADR